MRAARRVRRFEFRVTAEELTELRRRAQAARRPSADYAREATLGRVPPPAPPAVNIEVSGHLGRIGNNLNQLTRRMHEGGEDTPAQPELTSGMLDLAEALLDIREQLVRPRGRAKRADRA